MAENKTKPTKLSVSAVYCGRGRLAKLARGTAKMLTEADAKRDGRKAEDVGA